MTTTMRSAVAVVAAIGMALILAVAGCGPGMFGPSGTAAASQPVLVTEQVAPSALLAVTSAGGANGALFQALSATARPQAHLDIDRAGTARATSWRSGRPGRTGAWLW